MGSKRVLPPYDENGNGVVIDDRTLEEAKAERLELLADKRWSVETAGCLVGGMAAATDDRSKIMIEGARTAASANPSYAISNFKVAPGSFITLTAPQILAVSDAVRAHVQACFDNEAVISSQIAAAATNAAVDAVDITAGWPANP